MASEEQNRLFEKIKKKRTVIRSSITKIINKGNELLENETADVVLGNSRNRQVAIEALETEYISEAPLTSIGKEIKDI